MTLSVARQKAKKLRQKCESYGDIDLETGELSITRAITTVAGHGVVEGKPKSEASERSFTLPPSLTELLRQYKVWWDNYTESLGDKYNGCQRLFIGADGKMINPHTMLYWLRKVEDKAGLPRATIHSLRHTNISIQLFSGLIPDKMVSARAGHGSVKVTKDIYWELFKEDDKETAASIDTLFGL